MSDSESPRNICADLLLRLADGKGIVMTTGPMPIDPRARTVIEVVEGRLVVSREVDGRSDRIFVWTPNS